MSKRNLKLNKILIVNTVLAEKSMDAVMLSAVVIGSIVAVFILIFMIFKVGQKKTMKKIQVCYKFSDFYYK